MPVAIVIKEESLKVILVRWLKARIIFSDMLVDKLENRIGRDDSLFFPSYSAATSNTRAHTYTHTLTHTLAHAHAHTHSH